MTVSSLRPATTTSNTGAVTGAGGDADVALSDDSDATLITFDEGEAATFGLGDLTLPADAVIKAVRLRCPGRAARRGIRADGRTYPCGFNGGWVKESVRR